MCAQPTPPKGASLSRYFCRVHMTTCAKGAYGVINFTNCLDSWGEKVFCVCRHFGILAFRHFGQLTISEINHAISVRSTGDCAGANDVVAEHPNVMTLQPLPLADAWTTCVCENRRYQAQPSSSSILCYWSWKLYLRQIWKFLHSRL